MSDLKEIAAEIKKLEEPLAGHYKRLAQAAHSEAEKKLARYAQNYQRLQVDCLGLMTGKVPEKFQSFGIITDDNVNVRMGPGGKHSLVRMVNRGDRVVIKETQGLWVSVQLTDGTDGYIFKDYVSPDEI